MKIRYHGQGLSYNKINVGRNTGYTVRVNDLVSPIFIGNLGVKQGCCLSPTLSNVFQNDLHEIFSDGRCDTVLQYYRNTHLNSLSWVDDLVLMSTTKTGLQKCLDNLQVYCCRWVPLHGHLMFGDSPLEDADAFNYLGYCIKRSNDTSSIINDSLKGQTRNTHVYAVLKYKSSQYISSAVTKIIW